MPSKADRRRFNRCGQSLVEWALLLPVVMLTILFVLHLLFMVQVKSHLYVMAEHMAEASAIGDSQWIVAAKESPWFLKRTGWGLLMPPSVRQTTFAPWHPYTGVASLYNPGRMAQARATFRFRSRVATRLWELIGLPQEAFVELPAEPKLPGRTYE